MTLHATDLLKIQKLLRKQIQPALQRLDGIGGKLSKIEGRLTDVEGRLTDLEARLTSVDSSVKTLETKVKTGFSAIDRRLDKIEVWIPVANTDLVPSIRKRNHL